MDSRKKVSVAIGTSNSSNSIVDLIESILFQSVSVDEIVISDDCSIDDTLEKIETLKFRSPIEIKVLSNDIPIGRSENIEKALSCCVGDVILIAEPKYIWEKDRVEKVLQWFENNKEKNVLFTDVCIVDPESTKYISLFDEAGLKKNILTKLSVDTFMYCRALFATLAMTKDFNYKHSNCDSDYGYLLFLVAIDGDKLGCIDEGTVRFGLEERYSDYKLYPNFAFKNFCANEYKSINEKLSILSPKSINKMKFWNDRSGFSGRIVLKNRKRYKEIYGNKSYAIMCHDLSDILKKRFNTFFKVFSRKHVKYSKSEYASWIFDLKNNKSLFVPFTKRPYIRNLTDPKIFAYYLPQYYAIPENDDAHGKGFTEWTNVATCVPQFVGHYQPKIPYDIGFYNLTMPGVIERQVEIAKAYGIYGFCFYYYWFSGRKVLEKPLEYFLRSNIEFHFHFCWANENWSKLWDGGNKELILEQKLMDDDADKFFSDILPYITDKRYEKVLNKPILIIYRPSLFKRDKLNSFLEKLNVLARNNGFDGFYFLMTNAFGYRNPYDYNIEGLVEFPPHAVYCEKISVDRVDDKSNFNIYDMDLYVAEKKYLYDSKFQLYKSCFPSWDNLPRKSYSEGRCYIMSDYSFESWLVDIIEWTRVNNSQDKQYVYINAWNEWGEGAILEPTLRYGYKYLDIVKRCIERTRNL